MKKDKVDELILENTELKKRFRTLQHDRDLAMKNMLKQEKEVLVLIKKMKDTVEEMEDAIQEYYES